MTAPASASNITNGTPAVVIFDVNETLSDMAPLAASFDRVRLGAGAVEAWFAGVLRDGFALTAVGVNPGFAEIASEALHVRLAMAREGGTHPGSGAESAQQSVDEIMGTFSSLTVHPDVVEGVQALRELGARLVTLSNGSTGVAQGLFERAGLTGAFEALMTVEDAGAWKPHPAAYAYALDRCGVSASAAMLVAVHPWDIDGAARAGLRTGWLNRKGTRYPGYFTAPDIEATDLVQLSRLLS
ncbi:haloacid dehalogenase type II [Terrabacter koreensis]